MVEGFFLSDPAVKFHAIFSDGLQVCFIGSSCADRRYDGVFCRKCCGADNFKAAVFYFCLQFKKSVFVFAASVCSDQGSGGVAA